MPKMPVLFLGHGSPMNAIENNHITDTWRRLGKSLPQPRAILMFSAHWITEGKTLISTNNHPQMIYDMYGFPPELYRVSYPAPGSSDIAEEILETIADHPSVHISGAFYAPSTHDDPSTPIHIERDTERGLDHGIWSLLIHLFPDTNIPIIPMSIDYFASPESLMMLGEALRPLRERGILIIGSGNIVHNLSAIDWSRSMTHSWAKEFDEKVAQALGERDFSSIAHFREWGNIARLAHPSYDHLLPLFPLLGATESDDHTEFITPEIVLGSLSMRGMLWK